MPDNLFEIGFFVIAMIVMFVHWLIKQAGLIGQDRKETDEERRRLGQQLERRQAQRQARQGTSGPVNPQNAQDEWAALRQAMGLPASLGGAPPTPTVVRHTEHRHYEDSSDPECDDDLVEQANERSFLDDFETEGPVSANKAAAAQLLSASEAQVAKNDAAAYDVADARDPDAVATTAAFRRQKRVAAAAQDNREANVQDGIRNLFGSRSGLRQVILAREVLGRPKAWED